MRWIRLLYGGPEGQNTATFHKTQPHFMASEIWQWHIFFPQSGQYMFFVLFCQSQSQHLPHNWPFAQRPLLTASKTTNHISFYIRTGSVQSETRRGVSTLSLSEMRLCYLKCFCVLTFRATLLMDTYYKLQLAAFGYTEYHQWDWENIWPLWSRLLLLQYEEWLKWLYPEGLPLHAQTPSPFPQFGRIMSCSWLIGCLQISPQQ